MSTYAIIEIGGKQYKAEPGRELKVQKLNQASGNVTFDKVLLVAGEGETKVGAPYVAGVSVEASIVGEEKGEKIHVRKYRAKSRYRKHTGFRAQLTRIKIESVGGVKARKVESPKKVTPKTAASSKAAKPKRFPKK